MDTENSCADSPSCSDDVADKDVNSAGVMLSVDLYACILYDTDVLAESMKYSRPANVADIDASGLVIAMVPIMRLPRVVDVQFDSNTVVTPPLVLLVVVAPMRPLKLIVIRDGLYLIDRIVLKLK